MKQNPTPDGSPLITRIGQVSGTPDTATSTLHLIAVGVHHRVAKLTSIIRFDSGLTCLTYGFVKGRPIRSPLPALDYQLSDCQGHHSPFDVNGSCCLKQHSQPSRSTRMRRGQPRQRNYTPFSIRGRLSSNYLTAWTLTTGIDRTGTPCWRL